MELEEVDTGHKLWLQLSCSLLSDFLFHKTDLRTLHSTRLTHSPFTQSLLPRDPTFSTNWGLLISEVTLQVSSDCNRGWEKVCWGWDFGFSLATRIDVMLYNSAEPRQPQNQPGCTPLPSPQLSWKKHHQFRGKSISNKTITGRFIQYILINTCY